MKTRDVTRQPSKLVREIASYSKCSRKPLTGFKQEDRDMGADSHIKKIT